LVWFNLFKMAVRKIRIIPDPALRQRAKKITSIDDSIQRLIEDMIETLHAASGVGLAAPQVGVPFRVAVIHLPGEEAITLINPEIVKREGERVLEEGCLSVPGYQGEIKRSIWVKVKAQDRDGNHFKIKAEELLAQALEHEIDHLDGILYLDRLEGADKLWKLEQTPDNEES
jgi:peptide deformylase